MMRTKIITIVATVMLLFVALAGLAQGRTIYVDADANGLNDGSSWANAYNYLQDAFANANSNDDVNEIWIAEGIYTPDSNSAHPNGTGDRTATFQLINDVALRGGYPGFGQPDPNARDVDAYKTILSGDLDDNDIDVNDPVFLLWEPTRAENSYHVVTSSGTDPNAILDGFTITGGNANVFEDVNDSGGGMYNAYGSLTLINCTFSSNSAGNDGLGGGGGMYNYRSNPTLTNCNFAANAAGYDCGGGGMLNNESNPILTECIFSGNTAEYCGGGMINFWSNPTLTNCTFSDNLADDSGGGMHDDYGSFSPILTNCTFKGNSTNNYGGGMFITGNSTLTNCLFIGNSAAEGGGIWNYGSPTLTNCILSGNSADVGGGIYNDHSRLEMTNCTLSGNSALNGNALACDSYRQQYPSNLEITNCILWDDGNEIWNKDGSTITIRYSNIQGSWAGDRNIDADPCFANSGYWDASGIWIQGDYHLLLGSPCIDAGDPNYVPEPNEIDLDGKPRILDGNNDGIAVVDMGAYEYRPLIPAEVRVVPSTINLTSKGKWIAAFLWLPEDYNVADIEPDSVLLEHEIEPERFWVYEEKQVAIVKFNRSEVQGIINIGQAQVTITGQLTDETTFEGADVIRVINKGGPNSPK